MDAPAPRAPRLGMTSKQWNADAYDDRFRFVADAGRGLVDVLAPHPGERILDLGCGSGTLTAAIAAAGARVVGLDSDAAMLERARVQAPGVELIHADGQSFDVGERRFDAVFSNAALHWMPRAADVLACVRRALRPGGRFVAEMGGAGNVATLVDALAAARRNAGAPERPARWFFPSIASYARLLEHAGFEPRTFALFDRPTRLEGGADAAIGWYRMFADTWLDDLDAATAERIVREAADAVRPKLERDGAVWADYRRLRFEAAAV